MAELKKEHQRSSWPAIDATTACTFGPMPTVTASSSAPGRWAIIGLSAGNAEEAATVDPEIVDYAGVGPVYATGTKADAGAAIGPEGLRGLRARLALPLVAIGGINMGNAAEVMATGVEGSAVVSAIAGAADVEAAARALRDLVQRYGE